MVIKILAFIVLLLLLCGGCLLFAARLLALGHSVGMFYFLFCDYDAMLLWADFDNPVFARVLAFAVPSSKSEHLSYSERSNRVGILLAGIEMLKCLHNVPSVTVMLNTQR